MSLQSPAALVLGQPCESAAFVFTCEHASNELPAHLDASPSDRELLDDHWGWDIGTASVVRTLFENLGGQAVLGRFSRLVIDLNRDPQSPDLILTEADGTAIDFNRNLDEQARVARRDQFFAPYHDAVADAITARRAASAAPVLLLSVHSFTPVFSGEQRSVEVGVLFDEHDEIAEALAEQISGAGFACALNEPYSGKPPNGLIYSAGSHGRKQDVPYLELEIRNDLLANEHAAARVAARISPCLRAISSML